MWSSRDFPKLLLNFSNLAFPICTRRFRCKVRSNISCCRLLNSGQAKRNCIMHAMYCTSIALPFNLVSLPHAMTQWYGPWQMVRCSQSSSKLPNCRIQNSNIAIIVQNSSALNWSRLFIGCGIRCMGSIGMLVWFVDSLELVSRSYVIDPSRLSCIPLPKPLFAST